jgi:lipoic acid synthetase
VEEPARVAQAVAAMKLKHVVITSVTRDDLSDGGAGIFAEAIRQIRCEAPQCTVEVLIPDFEGRREALKTVLGAKPEILGHNVETVPRLYPDARPQAVYQRSLELLQRAKDMDSDVLTKSGIMVGIGETTQEVVEVMQDLRTVDCDIFTIGQYLRPTKSHLPVARYYTPDEFADLSTVGRSMGFRWVESGPLVRSSYLADAQAERLGVKRSD